MEGIIHKFENEYSIDINSVVDVNSVVDKCSGVYEYTVVDENSVVRKSSERMVDKNSVLAQFLGVDYCTLILHDFALGLHLVYYPGPKA